MERGYIPTLFILCSIYRAAPEKTAETEGEPTENQENRPAEEAPPEPPRLYIPIYLISKMLLFPGKASGEGNPPLHPSHQKFLKDRAAPKPTFEVEGELPEHQKNRP